MSGRVDVDVCSLILFLAKRNHMERVSLLSLALLSVARPSVPPSLRPLSPQRGAGEGEAAHQLLRRRPTERQQGKGSGLEGTRCNHAMAGAGAGASTYLGSQHAGRKSVLQRDVASFISSRLFWMS